MGLSPGTACWMPRTVRWCHLRCDRGILTKRLHPVIRRFWADGGLWKFLYTRTVQHGLMILRLSMQEPVPAESASACP